MLRLKSLALILVLLCFTGVLAEYVDENVEDLGPKVFSLDDSTFEHETQASTGATTGDWLVLFYYEDNDWQQQEGIFQKTANAIGKKLNVARVSLQENPFLLRRFLKVIAPAVVLLRHGTMYHFPGLPKTVDELVQFATDGFYDARSEIVPPPPSAFVGFLEQLRSNPILVAALAAVVFIVCLVIAPKNQAPVKRGTKKRD
eukprot:Colp12_sorted_trinity150504_noHs@4354